MNSFLGIVDKINHAAKWLLATFMAAALFILFLQVIFRFVIQIPVAWTEEASRYLIIWATFIGGGVAIRYGRMISLELILMKMSPKTKRIVSIIKTILTVFFCVLMVYFGIMMLNVIGEQKSPALGVQLEIPYLALPVGFSLMILNSVALLLDSIFGGESKE